MHHTSFGILHPLFALIEGEKATASRLAPTKSARRVHPSHLWSVMDAGQVARGDSHYCPEKQAEWVANW